ncbi:type II toxin-antitoxin system VapC family toxin [Thermococcus atlanticus]
MIVIDTSVFIDLFFRYRDERTRKAEAVFEVIEQKNIPILEPEIFKLELISQLVRRMEKSDAILTGEEVFKRTNFVSLDTLMELAFMISLETGSRATDSFYIAVAKINDVPIISNDRFQVRSAREFGVTAFYITENLNTAIEFLEGL